MTDLLQKAAAQGLSGMEAYKVALVGYNAGEGAQEIENSANKLLEAQYGERLDTGTAGAASRINPQLETVGESRS